MVGFSRLIFYASIHEGEPGMKLMKCPRCDLNYIQETESYCKVCLREMKGEKAIEEIDYCSVCNASPAMVGRDVCMTCLKEMQSGTSGSSEDDRPTVDGASIGLNTMSSMDEIIPEIDNDIPAEEYDKMQSELSLESVIEEENRDDDEEDDD